MGKFNLEKYIGSIKLMMIIPIVLTNTKLEKSGLYSPLWGRCLVLSELLIEP